MYWIDYYVNGRRKRERIGPSKKLAQSVLAKRMVEITENKYLDIKKERRVLFDVFNQQYLAFSRINKRSWTRDESSIKNLLTVFEHKYLHEIDPYAIEKYKALRKEKVSVTTINREIACLRHMFTKAIEWNKVNNNHVKHVKLFPENNQRTRYLSEKEIKLLCAYAPSYFKPIIMAALNTGMKRGEIMRLKWADVDLSKGIIYVREAKNNSSREIPINETLKDVLESLPRRLHNPYVFCNHLGKPYHDFSKAFQLAVKKAGIEDIRFHDLRHIFASYLIMDGVDLKTVQELLGHKTIRMTLRYTHLSPAHKKTAIEKIGLGRQQKASDGHQYGHQGIREKQAVYAIAL